MSRKEANAKGNYYKRKTKAWFIDDGYWCEYVEKYQHFMAKGKLCFIKRDLAGADGMAMNGKEIIFWNSKLNRKNIAAGIKDFLRFPYPPCVKLWLVVWEPRIRVPDIVEVPRTLQNSS